MKYDKSWVRGLLETTCFCLRPLGKNHNIAITLLFTNDSTSSGNSQRLKIRMNLLRYSEVRWLVCWTWYAYMYKVIIYYFYIGCAIGCYSFFNFKEHFLGIFLKRKIFCRFIERWFQTSLHRLFARVCFA